MRLLSRLTRAFAWLEPAPTEKEALAAQAALYDSNELVDDSKDAEGLFAIEEILAERWMRASDTVLDVGCGTGREALGLAARGMRITAIDVSERSTAIARARAAQNYPDERISVKTGDLDSLDFAHESFDVIFFASDVFASIPGTANRARVLRRSAALLKPRGRVFVQAMVPRGRLRAALLDGARSAIARWKDERNEKGDRWVVRGRPPIRLFRHVFPDDEAIVDELERGGLTFIARCGTYVVAEKRGVDEENLASARSIAREAVAVLRALPHVDHVRKTRGPKPAAALLRNEASNAPRRDARGRVRLARAIALCDRLYPFGRGGCYRRALLEVALDSGAAAEPLHLGLADPEGHAWLPRSWPADPYPAVFTI